ncbi:hypothetical protein [uncultured Zhongshania sp.]|jgi:hypothetical protein|uniref:hypothetical protein n=1 Tax=uncultured Zhongshania sp. TaxID=1642288 RepID=UPI0025D777ED|nr:hypothetical protein [uncultured Zhongshania sp.]
MKSIVALAAIGILISCANVPKTTEIVQTLQRIDPNLLSITRSGNIVSLYHAKELLTQTALRSGGGSGIDNLKYNNSRYGLYCKAEFFEDNDQTGNFRCEVTQYDAVILTVSEEGKKQLKKLEGAEVTNCIGFFGNTAVDCSQYDNDHLQRAAKRDYDYSFQYAERSNNYEKFIENYRYNDIGGLVPVALERQAAQQLAANKRQADQQRAANKVIIDFRTKIKVGDETHCGLVVELKPPIVQIQTSSGVRWVKIAETFPPNSRRCSL